MNKLLASGIATFLAMVVAIMVGIPRNTESQLKKAIPATKVTTKATNDVKSKNSKTTTKTTKKTTKRVTCVNPLTTTTTTTTTTKKVASYSEDDLYVLSHCMYGEAGGHGEKLLSYVGSVVLNRVKYKSFPNTIRGVVFQKGQYACTWDGNYNKTPDALTIRVAKQLLTNGSVLPSNVVFQAGFRQGSGTYAVVDGVYFCYA